MKNDITRDTFNPLKHFSRVLMQQGRVQLDADWNEQTSILLHYLRTLASDLIGPDGGPKGHCGFELIVDEARLTAEEDKKLFAENRKLLIAPGRYYVDGVLVENERFVSFFQQPGKPVADGDTEKILEKAGGPTVAVYLDVWERHVTPIEDDDIREKALGGPDTATRAKITWVVRARKLTTDEETALTAPGARPQQLGNFKRAFTNLAQKEFSGRGLLKADIAKQMPGDDACGTTAESAYRGVENQLYRVEIHRGGPALDGKGKPATFKWSRDNGSVAASWLDTDGDVLRINPLRDQARGFSKGQWVELIDDHREMERRRGTLVQLKDAEAGSLTTDPATASSSMNFSSPMTNAKVRRWDHAESENVKFHGGAVPIVEGQPITLEDGVQIEFQPAAPGQLNLYRTGDYWLIPARVATRDVEWPTETNEKGELVRVAVPPHGETHHHALLGLLGLSAAGKFTFEDCRREFAPLA